MDSPKKCRHCENIAVTWGKSPFGEPPGLKELRRESAAAARAMRDAAAVRQLPAAYCEWAKSTGFGSSVSAELLQSGKKNSRRGIRRQNCKVSL